MNPSRYNLDGLKVATIGTLLSGKALAWFSPYLEHADANQELLTNYGRFRALLEDVFGEPDRAVVASHILVPA